MILGLLALVFWQGLATFWPAPGAELRRRTTAARCWARSRATRTSCRRRSSLASLPPTAAAAARARAGARGRAAAPAPGAHRQLRADRRALHAGSATSRSRPEASRGRRGRWSSSAWPGAASTASRWPSWSTARSTATRRRRRSGALFAAEHPRRAAIAIARSGGSRRARSARINHELEEARLARARGGARARRATRRPHRRGRGRAPRRSRRARRRGSRAVERADRGAATRRTRAWSLRAAHRRRPEKDARRWRHRARLPGQPARRSAASCGVYAVALGRVPQRRAARGQQRGRRLPGDLRHRGDDAGDVAAGRAVRRAGRALPARVRQGRRRSSASCASRSTTWPACRASSSACSAWASSATSSAARIDALFFAAKLPNPTFGTGGLLWASLTLALLTLPVVIVATEEALAAVPELDARGLATPAARASGRPSGASCCRARCRAS